MIDASGKHVLYKTGDIDAPDSIKDNNGEVALGLCRICNKGEIELEGPCIQKGTPKKQRREWYGPCKTCEYRDDQHQCDACIHASLDNIQKTFHELEVCRKIVYELSAYGERASNQGRTIDGELIWAVALCKEAKDLQLLG